ncbi:hypothetical protein GCM10010412_088830 [Nonomuraea recticatena]|uniref:Uncharacterized protein n=1 Tax=Nonomuraea recticatena TaxID=46178 RepID=A0ABN3T7T3_9ACTN
MRGTPEVITVRGAGGVGDSPPRPDGTLKVETAVSIVAEVIASRRGAGGLPLSETRGPIHPEIHPEIHHEAVGR